MLLYKTVRSWSFCTLCQYQTFSLLLFWRKRNWKIKKNSVASDKLWVHNDLSVDIALIDTDINPFEQALHCAAAECQQRLPSHSQVSCLQCVFIQQNPLPIMALPMLAVNTFHSWWFHLPAFSSSFFLVVKSLTSISVTKFGKLVNLINLCRCLKLWVVENWERSELDIKMLLEWTVFLWFIIVLQWLCLLLVSILKFKTL